jgi:hypothetical protein
MSDAPAGTPAPAPAAPVTPAPEPQQSQEPPKSPLASAREAAAKMWEGEPAPTRETPTPVAAPNAEAGEAEPQEGEQPRGPDGKFLAKDAAPDAEEGAEEEEVAAAPEEGEADEDTPDEPVEAEDGAEDAPEGLLVKVPGRHPHDPDLEIEVTDPEVAERLRQLRNGYMRGEEVRSAQQATEAEWQQIASVEEHIQMDPVGFVRTQLPPEYAPRLALQMLADPKVLKAVEKDLRELITPATYRTKMAELKAEMYETRELLAQARSERQAGERHAVEVRSAVAAMIPVEYDAEKSGAFLQAALTDLSEYATRNNLSRLDPAQLPVLLARRLQEAGINPVQAAARLANGAGRKTSSGGPPKGRQPGASAGKPPAAPRGRPTGAKFVQGEARRRAVATTPPGGAGAPKAPVAPPKGTTLKEATAMARARRRS